MKENTNLNETYEVLNSVELTPALEVNVDGVIITLEDFASDYNSINNNITDLCIKAHHLAKFNRKIFMDYVIYTMGLSRVSAVQMINAGDLYVETGTALLPVSYTKVAELTPVKEQLPEYTEFVDGLENLYDKTQKDIRDSVKSFLNKANEQLTNLDEPETEEPETDEPETEEIESVSRETIDVTTDYLDIKGVVEMVKAYLSEFADKESEGVIIDADDVKMSKNCIANLDLLMKRVRTIINDGGLSYSDYTATDESEVIPFE